MRQRRAEKKAFAYRMNLLSRKLDTAVSLRSKATLDEWEAATVAKMLRGKRKGWLWKTSKP